MPGKHIPRKTKRCIRITSKSHLDMKVQTCQNWCICLKISLHFRKHLSLTKRVQLRCILEYTS